VLHDSEGAKLRIPAERPDAGRERSPCVAVPPGDSDERARRQRTSGGDDITGVKPGEGTNIRSRNSAAERCPQRPVPLGHSIRRYRKPRAKQFSETTGSHDLRTRTLQERFYTPAPAAAERDPCCPIPDGHGADLGW